MPFSEHDFVVVFQYSSAGEFCSTKVPFRTSLIGDAEHPCVSLAIAFDAIWVPELAQCMSENVAFIGTYCYCLLPGARVPHFLANPAGGVRAGDMLPPSQGVCITQYAYRAFVGPSVIRRSNVWSGIRELDQSNGALLSGAFGAWSGVAELYSTELSFPAASSSKFHSACIDNQAEILSDVEIAVVRSQLFSKRSRISRRAVVP